jgi:AraC family transcriptional regulator
LEDFAVEDTLLGLCLTGSAKIEVGFGKQSKRVVARPGKFILLGRGDCQRSIAWCGTRQTLYVAVSTEQLGRFMGQDIDPADLSVTSQYAISDLQVLRLISNMYQEIQAGCPTGKMYGEALSLTLGSYLLGRYSEARHLEQQPERSLSRRQATLVRDYIDANLASDIALRELAGVVGLSPHYFSSLFKNTFGVAPHHFVLSKRVQEGQKLLGTGSLSISEVAIELGFSDQSHFTQVFRKVTGTTPRRYQRRC